MSTSCNVIRAALLAVTLGTALPALADCVLPPSPSKIPDGSSANEQEMITAMQTLKQYDGDVNVYLKCLEFEQKQNRLSVALRDSRHNEAVGALEKVATKFNEQVRLFKAKHG
jgi:hypothetical protein